MLVDMPAGTVKGRALGAGTGDPQNLTSTQLVALTGIPFGQCRLALVSTTVMRLSRHNGCLLTIDNVPQVIPAAGVDLAPTGITNGVIYYIYAYMASGVMTLLPSTLAWVIDPRNGMKVLSSNAACTLVGLTRGDNGNVWPYNRTDFVGLLSYFNRRNLVTLSASFNGFTTSSGTPVVIAASAAYFLCWGDEAVLLYASGFSSNGVLSHNSAALGLDGGGFAAGQTMYISVAGSNVPFAATMAGAPSEAVLHNSGVLAWVSAGTGTFFGNAGAMVRG